MFFDKKFGLPQGLIDAANKVHKEHFVPNAKTAHHYERGDLSATVLPAFDEDGNQDGHMVKCYKRGKEQEHKRYYTLDQADAHAVAKEYIAKEKGMDTFNKEEVTFSEAELAHINELLVPNTGKISGTVGDYLKNRSAKRGMNASFLTATSVIKGKNLALPAPPKKNVLALPAPAKQLALPAPAEHTATNMVKAHNDLHNAPAAAPPLVKKSKAVAVAVPVNGPIKPPVNRSGTTAPEVLERQKARSAHAKSFQDIDPIGAYAAKHNLDKGNPPVAVSADPPPKQTVSAAPAKAGVKTAAPKHISTAAPVAAQAAKSVPGKKQAPTGKAAGKKAADLTPSVKPAAGKSTRVTKTGASIQSQEPFRFKGGETHSKPKSIIAPEPKFTRTKEKNDKKAASTNQTSMFGTAAEVKSGKAKIFVKQQDMPDYVVDTNRSMDKLPPIVRKKKITEDFSEAELAHIKSIMEKE